VSQPAAHGIPTVRDDRPAVSPLAPAFAAGDLFADLGVRQASIPQLAGQGAPTLARFLPRGPRGRCRHGSRDSTVEADCVDDLGQDFIDGLIGERRASIKDHSEGVADQAPDRRGECVGGQVAP